MTVVTFVPPGGAPITASVPTGANLLRVAMAYGVSGLVAECGGDAVCGTCHVFISGIEPQQLDAMSEAEDELLDNAAAPRRSDSRLACQLTVPAAPGPIVVTIAAEQWRSLR
ncbi:2Fe-2S iron-sulfur cluster-binding protein [Dactylosporangium fulvum]|uniref:(2Fe-2S)-binding protein n=1 Tax=Dactylosporangium fulvum TaxID=53359 RepID=A0ABY5WBQ3_9ACTN|nr:(2Fe-2S)-binding protein [Dactylosporangium fulvum]UWP85526.1 (2Fe-2S)-binding protein [Dactylosporangium fulvum]